MCVVSVCVCVCASTSSFPSHAQHTHTHTLTQVNSSLVFFLFSFQVHEKSILLSTLPCSLLTHHHPHTVTWFQLLALFSMYPLLTQDGLVLACWALGVFYLTIALSVQPAKNASQRLPHLCRVLVSVWAELLAYVWAELLAYVHNYDVF